MTYIKLKIIFIDYSPNVHAVNFRNAFRDYFYCELYFWQIMSFEEKTHVKSTISTYDFLICADIFKLEDIIRIPNIKKICISWTSDILKMQTLSLPILDDHFELLIVDCDYTQNLWRKDCFLKTPIFQLPYGVNPNYSFVYDIDSRKNVISTRNWNQNYNQRILLEAISRNSDLCWDKEFHFAGEGPTFVDLTNSYNKLQEQNFVKFLGSVPNNKIINLISKYKLYISTSLSDGISVSMLEAMSAGTPVLVSDIPSNKEIIDHGVNGFLYVNDSVDDLSLKIKEIFENNFDLKQISHQAKRTIERKANWQLNIKLLVSTILKL